jgi:predicted DNA-binding WGR domain protein
MKKYYKAASKGQLLYKEVWLDHTNNTFVLHYGKVGYKGKTEAQPLDDSKTSAALLEEFCRSCEAAGYAEIGEEQYATVVVQFPLKSAFGNRRDLWLRDTVQEYLNDHLGWRGFGYVDGYDMGQKRLNIFCKVIAAESAVGSIKACLRKYRLDLNQARIAVKEPGATKYTMVFSYNEETTFDL